MAVQTEHSVVRAKALLSSYFMAQKNKTKQGYDRFYENSSYDKILTKKNQSECSDLPQDYLAILSGKRLYSKIRRGELLLE